jgi:hypothetical protein
MQNHVRNIMSARPAIPPTTPPAMAPTGVDEDCWEDCEEGVGEAEEGGIEEEGTIVAGSIESTS